MAYGNPQRLYVLETKDGIIKGGITSRGDERIRQHARLLEVSRHHIGSQFIVGVIAESELLARLASIGTLVRGREWFSGVDFLRAVQLVEEISREFANANPTSKAHLLRTGRSLLRFNDEEIAVLDAYCRLVGKSRSVAARDLMLGGLSELVSARHEKNFARATT